MTCSRVATEPEAVTSTKPWAGPQLSISELKRMGKCPACLVWDLPGRQTHWKALMHTLHDRTRMDGFSTLSPDLKG